MAKIRLLLFLLTVLIVAGAAYFFSFYARGYSFDTKTLKFIPNGLLVLKSYPDSAQILIDGEIKTATNATLRIPPKEYDVTIRKDGFREWKKRLAVQKEVVTEATAHLFKLAPSLSSMNFLATINPVPSEDFSKIAYYVPPHTDNSTLGNDNGGLWVMEMLNLPLGFNRDPRKITDGDLSNSSWTWSPDGRQIMLTTKNGSYLLDSGTFTAEKDRDNVSPLAQEMLDQWKAEDKKKLESQTRSLPAEVQDMLLNKSKSVVFSPDEDMVLYTASASGKLDDYLIPQLPGASTQKQERDIKSGRIYVYDIKEDRNFLIEDSDQSLTIEGGATTNVLRRISWFPTSRHLVLAQPNSIVIMDYDGTNRQEVYQGVYVSPNAYPAISTDRLLILTNLGAQSPPNLYYLNLK